MRFGVIGFGGRISSMINYVMREVAPEVRVVGIVDPNEAAARSRLADCDRDNALFCGSVDELVRQVKPDALLIGTRCGLHTPYAIEASRYDLPLFLEKPVATSMEQALALETAFENTKCEVVVSFPLRVSPLCELCRQVIAEGRIGTPEHVLAQNYVPYGTCYFDAFYRDFESTQGLFLQKATHDFDYLMYLVGAPVVRVGAMASHGRVFGGDKPAGLWCADCDEQETCLESPQNRQRNLSGGDGGNHLCVFGEDIGTPATGMNEDSSSALLEFANGTKGVYTQVFFSRRDSGTRGCTVSGYHGTVSFDWYTGDMKYVRHHRPFSDVTKSQPGMSHFGGDLELAYDFVALVRSGKRPRTPIETGIQSAYSCLAAKQSSEQGIFVDVRQVGAER